MGRKITKRSEKYEKRRGIKSNTSDFMAKCVTMSENSVFEKKKAQLQ